MTGVFDCTKNCAILSYVIVNSMNPYLIKTQPSVCLSVPVTAIICY